MTRPLLLLLCGLVLPSAVSAQSVRRLFISVDMEAIAGVVTGEQLGPGGFEYERFRRFQTEEVLAVRCASSTTSPRSCWRCCRAWNARTRTLSGYVGPDIPAISRFLTVTDNNSLDLEP